MMSKINLKKLLILNIPYILVGLFATNFGEAWRLAEGTDSSAKILSFFYALPVALGNPLPSFHPLDLLVGIACGAGLRLAVYLKSKNAKKYRHNVEYGSARWGTAKDIEPFTAPKFEDNIILRFVPDRCVCCLAAHRKWAQEPMCRTNWWRFIIWMWAGVRPI